MEPIEPIQNSGNGALLYFSAMLLNIITYFSGEHPIIKTIVAVLGISLTVVSFINQSTMLYKNAQTWPPVIIVKNYYKRSEKEKGEKMKQIVTTLWNYFSGMNSEIDGKPSIKRNMAWGYGTMLAFVEVYSLIVVPKVTEAELKLFYDLCKFFAVLDTAFILLDLSITSVDKLTELAQKIRGGVYSGPTPTLPVVPAEPPPLPNPPPIIANAVAEIEVKLATEETTITENTTIQ